MEMAGKHSNHYFHRRQAKIVTTIDFFFEKNEKNEKCLELPEMARTLIGKFSNYNAKEKVPGGSSTYWYRSDNKR
jgi:hypothetical protein